MSDDELLQSLDTYACQLREANAKLIYAAKARIDALRGEVERLRSTFNAGTVEQILKVTQDRAEKAEAENARLTEERDSAQRVGIQTMRERDEARADEELMSKAKQACEAENARLKGALEVPKVWTEEERDGMMNAWRSAREKHGMNETIFAMAAWLLRYRAAKALGETT